MSKPLKIVSPYTPNGDQPDAIVRLCDGLAEGHRFQTLLGVTGSGKTFTVANVIERMNRPTLVLAPNKTLAAQLCEEFRALFPENAVEYFVSYYDYYQPEAYIPQSDTYIEKDAAINEEIDRLRHSATQAVLERRDVIIVASVSCIYGLGSPEDYKALSIELQRGEDYSRDEIIHKLVDLQFTRNDIALERGRFRVRGDVLEVHAVDTKQVTRVEMFGDTIERITVIDPLTGEILDEPQHTSIFPASHYVSLPEKTEHAVEVIEAELQERYDWFIKRERILEAQRLMQRTRYDLEMIREIGYCNGIENYSRHFDGRSPGQPPFTLLDYFPKDFLCIIDESHQTVSQLHGMYAGDRSRKDTLVDFGFRLPCAYDNRPLTFDEFEERVGQVIFTSATPGPYERAHSGQIVEQIVRPTGLLDPEIIVRPTKGQVDDLLEEIKKRIAIGERVLVTTLTKKMAEDLTDYLIDLEVKVHYLHSDLQTFTRSEILRDFRLGTYDVIVGINLLREGLDLPEVTLVAILDADKEGFLRSETSLIQTIGRAARNVKGQVIMYADKITDSMKYAIGETNRRRALQLSYNERHNITPMTIVKDVRELLNAGMVAEEEPEYVIDAEEPGLSLEDQLAKLEKKMLEAAKALKFEEAAQLRDKIILLQGKKPQQGPKTPKRHLNAKQAVRAKKAKHHEQSSH
ncbi:MAG TPA: excinuclease ABC subunit UvrB [Armatimonadota bacterium]|nr:excinuclease ABC subunit UvrB [Armatimonadota bacterium]